MLRTPEFSRKTLMLGAGMGFLALATGCARTGSEAQPAPAASPAASTAAAAPEWEYTGAMGPQEWGTLSPSYTSCQAGTAQSPIDLTGGALNGTASGTGDQGTVIQLQYQSSDAEVVNNGHTSELHSTAPQVMLLNGQPWTFKQFHYHAPSEHTLDGKRFEAEFHFVHQSDDGRLAVLGVLAVEGPNNAAWAAFVDAAAAAPAAGSKAPAGVVDLGALIPASLDHFAYTGSLTTPPCSENVQWLVLETPVELGRAQLDALTAVHDGNDRPLQSLNGRAVSVVHQ
jgi:carbonic anhydrase